MRLPPENRITNPEPKVLSAELNPNLSLNLTPATANQAILTFTYAGNNKPIAGIKITMTESDGTVTILTTDVNGQVTLPTTSNTYTLSASLAETGEEAITPGDALTVLQYYLGLITLDPALVTAADVNGDGLPDFVTGKRWYAHGGRDPGGNDPAVFFWYELRRSGTHPEWIRHPVDSNSGPGTQFEVQDVNQDGMLDIVTSNKKGTHLFLQKRN